MSASDTLIGTVIDGRFEIRDKLGQGGMGTVYRAWQRSVGREVAIKLIDRSIASDPMAVQRFLREAHLASQLSHPNTISVLDFGQLPDGRLFTAMELVRGHTLGRELRAKGPFPLDRIIRIGTQICDALEAAHGARIVHRDLKLDNVMLLERGNDLIKVLDFGLAKTIDDKSTQATAAGIVVGTPRYIAPETAMTGKSSPASDMYALGVMLGELALATPLWEGVSLSVILKDQLQPAPILGRIPQPLRSVCARLLDVNETRRPTATETRGMLQQIAGGTPLPDPEPDAAATAALKKPQRSKVDRTNRTYLLVAGGLLVFVASVLIAYFATRKPAAKTAVVDKRGSDDIPDVTVPDVNVPDDPPERVDPWQESARKPAYDPMKSPIVEAYTGTPDAAQRTVKVVFKDVPPGYQLEVDGVRRYTTTRYYATAGKPVRFVFYTPDRSDKLYDNELTPTEDMIVDIGPKSLDDCKSRIFRIKDKTCVDAYCRLHPGEPGCEKPD